MIKLESKIDCTRKGVNLPLDNRGEEAEASIDSTSLMSGRREVTIVHGSDRYRLRITANDKLILTK